MKNYSKSALLGTLIGAGVMTLLAGISSSAHACSSDGKEGFLPRNSLYIPPPRREILDETGAPVTGGITESEFNGVISAVEKIYAPIIAKLGGKLNIERNWNDGTVNAYANREGDIYNVAMFGGLARHPETTIDGFMLVVCHELGHHIGGAPKYDRGDSDEWATNEGGSDYFATLKCARRVLQRSNNLAELPQIQAPDSVRRNCLANFPNSDNDAAICIRSSMGGLSLARLLASISEPTPPSEDQMPWFSKRDLNRVSTTFDRHPKAQCRLDTYYNGALCEKSHLEDVDQKDALAGVCASELGYKVGVRPRCWYAPLDANGDSGNRRTERRRAPPPADPHDLYW